MKKIQYTWTLRNIGYDVIVRLSLCTFTFYLSQYLICRTACTAGTLALQGFLAGSCLGSNPQSHWLSERVDCFYLARQPGRNPSSLQNRRDFLRKQRRKRGEERSSPRAPLALRARLGFASLSPLFTQKITPVLQARILALAA